MAARDGARVIRRADREPEAQAAGPPGAAGQLAGSSQIASPADTGAATHLECAACGASPGPREPWPFRCANAGAGGADHVIARRLDPARARWAATAAPNPFVRHRGLLFAHARAASLGLGDAEFTSLVDELDARVAGVEGKGFRVTPFAPLPARPGGGPELWAKDETANVSGSHKARHLFGLALHLELAERAGIASREESDRRGLAIASCGNAALAAAVIARATGRPLRVFIPTDANPGVVAQLGALGAHIAICPRETGVSGDPCLHGFQRAIAAGALPFCVQGSENGLAIEGGMTLGWELVEQLAERRLAPAALFVQVGGGALASATWQALRDALALGALGALPRLHAVQTHGSAPLRRAYLRVRARALAALGGRALGDSAGLPRAGDPALADDPANDAALAARLTLPDAAGAIAAALADARAHRDEFMRPWEAVPHSVAHGILDDETYDWAEIVSGMLESGGWPVTASEEALLAASAEAHAAGIRADATGAAGLAGARTLAAAGVLSPRAASVVLLTGRKRY